MVDAGLLACHSAPARLPVASLHSATLLAYTVAAAALILTPGPDTAFVLAQSVGGGRTAGVRAAAGVSTGILVHTVAAVVGLAAVLQASAVAYDAITLLGAAYLVYLGVDILRSGEFDLQTAPQSGGFRRGLVTNVLNPKVALFFLAFLPQFGTGFELLPLGGLYAGMTALYLGGLAALSGRARATVERPGVRRWLRRVAGGTTIGLGLLAAREAL